MSEFKGTKGKWELQKDNSILSQEFEKKLIAQICSANNNEVEKIANAKLIACAPEMFEMLERAEHWCACVNKDANIVKDLQQLIKKATL